MAPYLIEITTESKILDVDVNYFLYLTTGENIIHASIMYGFKVQKRLNSEI